MRIGLIGAGNLAWNLGMSLKETEWQVLQVISRDLDHARQLAEACSIPHWANQPEALIQDLDLVLICSSDHMIGQIAQQYASVRGQNTVFAHTAGSIPLSELSPLGPRTGVFYPLQTFTRGHLTDLEQVPIFLEGNEEVLGVLYPLAKLLSEKVQTLDSAGRLQLHLGAVFASNFANFMWILAQESLQGLPGLDFKVYGPLIKECASKALKHGPLASQTGPARRGDMVTMAKHMELLAQHDPGTEHLYQQLSEMIAGYFQEPHQENI